MYSVLTYPSPAPPPGSSHYGYGAMAVGPRWLAYAAHQPLVAITGRVSPQHLTPTASPSTSPANGSFVAHYAKESSKHIVAGVVKLSDMGYKTLSNYYSELMPDGGNASPGVGSPNGHRNGHSPWQGSPPLDPEFAGTVSFISSLTFMEGFHLSALFSFFACFFVSFKCARNTCINSLFFQVQWHAIFYYSFHCSSLV